MVPAALLALHRSLGILDGEIDRRTLVLVPDAKPAELTPLRDEHMGERIATIAYPSYKAMQLAAAQDGIPLIVQSGFRDVWMQASLFRRFAQTMSMQDILRGAMPPGYSEHHSGCALDLMGVNGKIVADSREFRWLVTNAPKFGFRLSYPPGNRTLIFEPWHWYFER